MDGPQERKYPTNVMIRITNIGLVGVIDGKVDREYIPQSENPAENRVTRDYLKEVFSKFGEVKYIEYRVGTDQGIIRFNSETDPEAVQKSVAAAIETPIMLGGSICQVSSLTPEEETQLWTDIGNKNRERKMQQQYQQQQYSGYQPRPYQPRDGYRPPMDNNYQPRQPYTQGYQPKPYQPRDQAYPPRDFTQPPRDYNQPPRDYHQPPRDFTQPPREYINQQPRDFNNMPPRDFDNQYQPRQYQPRPYNPNYQNNNYNPMQQNEYKPRNYDRQPRDFNQNQYQRRDFDRGQDNTQQQQQPADYLNQTPQSQDQPQVNRRQFK